jgi:putative flippase GtrA
MDWINIKQALTHASKGKFISAIRCAFKVQVMRYIFSGGTAALVNLATLHALVEYAGVYYLFASGIAFLVALLVSFTLHKFFTFGDTEARRIPRQMVAYVCLLGLNILINLALMWIIVDGLGVMYLIAQVLVSGAIAIWSFFAYRHIVFRTDTISIDTHAEDMPQELQR